MDEPVPRPKLSGHDLWLAIAPAVLEDMAVTDEVSPEEFAKDMEWESPHGDAYALAKHLDDLGWKVDSTTVEALDGASWHASDAEARAELKWVEETKPINPFPVGSAVRVRTLQHGEREGVVVDIDDARARSTVCIESLGHIREGFGTRGVIVAWEEIKAAGEVPNG